MSTTSTKRPWSEAADDAHAFRDLFTHGTTHLDWIFAGSLRRKRPEVGDVEHVVRPLDGLVEVSGGLFGQSESVNMLWHRLDELVTQGVVAKHVYGDTGFRWGSKYRGVDFRGHLHEIFTADSANWGCQLLIRTGPAEYSERVVSVLKHGGMYRQQDGYLVHVASGEVVPVPDEKTYLRLAGLPWAEPEDRK